MHVRALSILLASLALAACQGLGPHPYDLTGQPHASVSGSHGEQVEDHTPAFRVTKIDGWPVNTKSAQESGKPATADDVNTIAVGRTVRVDFEGLMLHANAVRSMFWDAQRVDGHADFTPADGERYVVRGEIGPAGSTVWLENEATHELVGQKFAAAPKAAASVPDMRSTTPQ